MFFHSMIMKLIIDTGAPSPRLIADMQGDIVVVVARECVADSSCCLGHQSAAAREAVGTASPRSDVRDPRPLRPRPRPAPRLRATWGGVSNSYEVLRRLTILREIA
jgi:hypothetical protein